ncbi:MAG: LysM peptidoglycan-binding domain-containing protein [Nocardioidaceae bacterium]
MDSPTARIRRLTASTTAGGMMLVGMPLALDYVVRPGDTLSEIAERHDTSVERIVTNNDLPRSGDHVIAGIALRIPAAHSRAGASPQPVSARDRVGGRSHYGPDARRMVTYTVRPGDTPSGLAVRFHAWTAELIERNGSVLRVGEQVQIPVVLAAVAEERRAARSGAGQPQQEPPRTDSAGGSATPARSSSEGASSGPSRAAVRRAITAAARRHGVDPQLALAVSWQEAGWQMHHTSYAGAAGAMQVIPATGEWMSGVVGRDLDLRDLRDNVTAGVVLLKILVDQARLPVAVAGYYQGLAGVREHGMYRDTKAYVANVLALRKRFAAGQYPE